MIAAQRLSVVPSELPDPPYPIDTVTKGWRFELDLQRVWKSDTWVLCPPEMRPWLYHIWAVAFEQHPAGSLPNNRDLIAAHIGIDRRTLEGHADVLLRGFTLHSDGRLYHSVVVERVLNLLGYRDSERERKAKYRNSKKNKETCPAGQTRDRRGNPVVETPLELVLEQEQEKTPKPPQGDVPSLPPEVDPDAWFDFVRHRKDIKKPLTDLAAAKNMSLLATMSKVDQREAVDTTIRNRWTGLFHPKRKPGDEPKPGGFRGARV